jgi:hypothetical protein
MVVFTLEPLYPQGRVQSIQWLGDGRKAELICQDLMFVDPYIVVKFLEKNPKRCNDVSKFYYSLF